MNRLPKKLELPSLEFPMAYTVPFDWGALHVTEQASHKYGIIPLTATTIDGGDFEAGGGLTEPRVDVVLAAPDERNNSDDTKNIEIGHAMSRKRVGVTVGLSDDQTTLGPSIAREIPKMFSQAFEQMPNEIKQLFPEHIIEELRENPLEIDQELLAHKAPQMLAHQLMNACQVGTYDITREWSRARYDAKHVRRVGRLSLASVGSVLIPVPGLVASGPNALTSLTLAIATGTGVLQALTVRNVMLAYTRAQPQAIQNQQAVAKVLSEKVEDDIHSTFCSAHFDRQIESQFGAGTDDGPIVG